MHERSEPHVHREQLAGSYRICCTPRTRTLEQHRLGPDTTAITGTTDVSVSGVSVSAPATANAGATFVVTVNGTVNLGLASSAAVAIGLTARPTAR